MFSCVTGKAAKFKMILKLMRGDSEKKIKREVRKSHEGFLHLNHIEVDLTKLVKITKAMNPIPNEKFRFTTTIN